MVQRDLKLVSPEGDRLPATHPFHNEGRTPAGWVLCFGLMIGSALTGAGIISQITWLAIAGLVVVVLTLIVSPAMRAAGLGQPDPSTNE